MLWLLLLPTAWVALALALDRFGMRPAPDGQFDALVVPGCAVREDGTASNALRRRTLHAVELWHRGVAPRLVLTGGRGRFAPSEAEAAALIAREAGMPPGALLLETRSTTTAENAAFAALLDPEAAGWSVLVVTDGYHAWRCRRLFRRHFESAQSVGSKPTTKLRFHGAIREVAAIGSMFAKRTLNA